MNRRSLLLLLILLIPNSSLAGNREQVRVTVPDLPKIEGDLLSMDQDHLRVQTREGVYRIRRDTIAQLQVRESNPVAGFFGGVLGGAIGFFASGMVGVAIVQAGSNDDYVSEGEGLFVIGALIAGTATGIAIGAGALGSRWENQILVPSHPRVQPRIGLAPTPGGAAFTLSARF